MDCRAWVTEVKRAERSLNTSWCKNDLKLQRKEQNGIIQGNDTELKLITQNDVYLYIDSFILFPQNTNL